MNENLLIIIIFAFFLWMIFPIFCHLNFHFDILNNKYYFSIYLYNFIKIYSGYFTISNSGLVIHLTKNKAIIFPFNQFKQGKKKFEITRGFEIININQTFECGIKDNLEYNIYVNSLYQIISNISSNILMSSKNFINIKNTTVMIKDENIFKITAKLTMVFNMVVIVLALSKLLLEKLFYYGKRKKS